MDRMFGPLPQPDGLAFRLHAPDADRVELLLDDRVLPMERTADGMRTAVVPNVAPGARYAFRVDGRAVPDPAALAQEADVHGRSIVVDPALFGRNRRLGRPFAEAVIEEVHVGTATPEGTFRGLVDRLDHYAALGVTALQLLPVNAFAGTRNWGYDGVLLYAPAAAYGTPEDLVALVAAAHARGLQIFLDVVYNHFGPDGNYIPSYDHTFFDPAIQTPWGAAIDFRRAEVRRFFIDNALHWVEGYGIDGLRFDAVHAFAGEGREAFLKELAAELGALQPRPHTILENDDNLADLLERDAEGRPLRFDAQWNDDLHHALHVLVTGEDEGYYAPYAVDPVADLARALSEGFVYQGEPSPNRGGEPRGQPSGHLHPTAFVVFTQNHDQIGNRALGDRLTEAAPEAALDLCRLVLLLGPNVPMLFQGEEFATRRRFPFFCDHAGDLGEAVRKGRRAEFAQFAAFSGEDIPDPIAAETFEEARLDWSEADADPGRRALEATRTLLALRHRHLVPLLKTPFRGAERTIEGGVVRVRWRFEAGDWTLVVNPHATAGSIAGAAGPPLSVAGSVDVTADGLRLGPWSAGAFATR